MPFSSLGLAPSLLKALATEHYKEPYPIQQQAIPAIVSRKDVLGIAQTGSGKTASYVLPILTNSLGRPIQHSRHIQTLVLVPTRELAVQVTQVFHTFGAFLPETVKCLAVFGGASINPQMMAMQGTKVLVATPGRLLELLESNALHLSDVETLVLDEADKMLSMGFKDEMNRIIELLPKKRQNLLFSATLSEDINEINQILLRNPVVIKISDGTENIDLITQSAFFVSDERKGPLLRYLIKSREMKQVLVFTSSVFKADSVADKLRKNKIPAEAIHSQKSQGARTDVLARFKAGHVRVLVATDLISRGIDIQFLPFVINYELPRSPKDYIHRIGRTGRAESLGEAISLITPEEEHHFKIIQKKMGKRVNTENSDTIDLKGF